MVDRRDLWKAVGGLNVDVERPWLGGMGDGTMKPAVGMIGGKDTSLCVIPPFLKQGEGMICGGIDEFKAMRASRKSEVLSGSVEGGVVGEWRQIIGEGRMVLVKECDGSCV